MTDFLIFNQKNKNANLLKNPENKLKNNIEISKDIIVLSDDDDEAEVPTPKRFINLK